MQVTFGNLLVYMLAKFLWSLNYSEINQPLESCVYHVWKAWQVTFIKIAQWGF